MTTIEALQSILGHISEIAQTKIQYEEGDPFPSIMNAELTKLALIVTGYLHCKMIDLNLQRQKEENEQEQSLTQGANPQELDDQ